VPQADSSPPTLGPEAAIPGGGGEGGNTPGAGAGLDGLGVGADGQGGAGSLPHPGTEPSPAELLSAQQVLANVNAKVLLFMKLKGIFWYRLGSE
jgi:hypothetical protein